MRSPGFVLVLQFPHPPEPERGTIRFNATLSMPPIPRLHNSPARGPVVRWFMLMETVPVSATLPNLVVFLVQSTPLATSVHRGIVETRGPFSKPAFISVVGCLLRALESFWLSEMSADRSCLPTLYREFVCSSQLNLDAKRIHFWRSVSMSRLIWGKDGKSPSFPKGRFPSESSPDGSSRNLLATRGSP